MVVPLALEIKDKRQSDKAIGFFFREEIIALHLTQNGVAAGQRDILAVRFGRVI